MRLEDLKPNDTVYCANLNESNKFRVILHSKGFTWADGGSYMESFGIHYECFHPLEGTFSSLFWSELNAYNIIPFREIRESPYRIGLCELYPFEQS